MKNYRIVQGLILNSNSVLIQGLMNNASNAFSSFLGSLT